MSAAQQKIPSAKPDEPTMEEILASIRRIIADEGAADAKPAAAAAPVPAPALPPLPAMRPAAARPAPPAPKEEVLDLATFSAPQVNDVTLAGAEDLDFVAPKPAPPAAAQRPQPAAPPVQSAPAPAPMPAPAGPADNALLSLASSASAATAFNALNHLSAGQGSKTIEEMARELLRPMLKGWLDENLPSLVERLVRAEIERVARGGR